MCFFYTENVRRNDEWEELDKAFPECKTWELNQSLTKGTVMYLNNSNGIKSLTELPEGYDIILIQPKGGREIQGETSLIDFNHPENCIYIFGTDDWYLPAKFIEGINIKDKVYIPIQGELWASQAAGMVLYDRLLKSNI